MGSLEIHPPNFPARTLEHIVWCLEVEAAVFGLASAVFALVHKSLIDQYNQNICKAKTAGEKVKTMTTLSTR